MALRIYKASSVCHVLGWWILHAHRSNFLAKSNEKVEKRFFNFALTLHAEG
jgi:hypothetical protein